MDMTRANWVVTVRQLGSIRPIGFEYFETDQHAKERAAQMRVQIKNRGWAYTVHVGEVITEKTA